MHQYYALAPLVISYIGIFGWRYRYGHFLAQSATRFFSLCNIIAIPPLILSSSVLLFSLEGSSAAREFIASLITTIVFFPYILLIILVEIIYYVSHRDLNPLSQADKTLARKSSIGIYAILFVCSIPSILFTAVSFE